MENKQLLNTILEKETENNNIINNSYKIPIELPEEQTIHINSANGEYVSKNTGKLVFLFNNEKAWVWNKYLELNGVHSWVTKALTTNRITTMLESLWNIG